MATVKTRVARGIRWLDQNVSGPWWIGIPVHGGYFVMAHPCKCVFGWAFAESDDSIRNSGFMKGMAKLREQGLCGKELGFDSNGAEGDLKALQKEWSKQISERQRICSIAMKPLWDRISRMHKELSQLKKEKSC